MLVAPPGELKRLAKVEHEKYQNEVIEGLLNNFDKETAEGNNITVNDCAIAPAKVEIHGKEISQETREGYNKFDIEDGTYNSNNNLYNLIVKNGECFVETIDENNVSNGVSFLLKLKTPLKLKSGESYTIVNGINANYPYINLRTNVSEQYEVMTSADKGIHQFTSKDDVEIKYLYVFYNTDNKLNFSPMLLEGSYTVETMPDFEQYGAMPSKDFLSSLEYVESEQMLNHSNVNLANTNNISSKLIYGIQVTNNDDGSISLKGTSTEDLSTSGIDLIERIDINNKNEGFLTVQVFGVPENSENGTINVYYFGVLKNEEVRSTNVNAGKVIRIVLRCNLGAKIDCTIRPFVTKGKYTKENIPAYIKHQSETVELTNLPEMYSKNDYIYYDENLNKYFVHNEYEKIIADGINFKFTGKSGTANNNLFIIDNLEMKNKIKKYDNAHIADIYSNYFMKNSGNFLYSNNLQGIAIRVGGDIVIGFGLGSEIDTVEKANQFLMENTVELVYPLAVPTDTEITSKILIEQLDKLRKIMSYKGTNHFIVTSENGQSANLKAIVYKDTFKILKEEIDNLKALLLES